MQINKILIFIVPVILALSSCENTANDTKTNIVRSKTVWTFLDYASKKFEGDFNGDGAVDKLYLVEAVKLSELEIENAVRHKGWPYYGEGTAPKNMNTVGPYVLVIVEGGEKSDVFHLVYDPNATSILAAPAPAPAAKSVFVVKKTDKNNSAWTELGDSAIGDILVIPTEAGLDSYFGWNGFNYLGFELLEMP